MKKLKIVTTLVLTALMTQLVCFGAQPESIKGDEHAGKEIPIEVIKNQTQALETAQKLRLAVSRKNPNEKRALSKLDNYAGSYINDAGNLTVLICDKNKFAISRSANEKTTLQNNVQNEVNPKKIESYQAEVGQAVEYKTAKFKLDYLKNIYNYTGKNMKKLGIISSSLSETNNIVTLGVKNMDENEAITAKLFENIEDFNRDSIRFEIAEDFEFKSTSYPGRRVYKKVSAGITEGTSGFNAKDTATGKYGVVTAGHGVKSGENLYNNNGTLIGTASKWQLSKKTDAAFVPYNSGFNPTRRINGASDNVISGYIKVADIKEGMAVCRYGCKSGAASCKILGVNFNAVINNISLTNLAQISCVSQGGDSGGPVVVSIQGPTLPGEAHINQIVGTVSAGNSNSTLVTKTGYVLTALKLSLY